jgi:thiamine kinase-like enzyme
VPDGYTTIADLARRIRDAFDGEPEHAAVPCHNDLLPGNFVCDAERRVRIVDWEYAGQNDRFFDLGNLSVNNELTEDDDRTLLEAYFRGPVTAQRFAALRLMRVVSDIREAMWGLVQSAVSRLDEDYDAYARRYFARLLEQAADPRIAQWLEEARG